MQSCDKIFVCCGSACKNSGAIEIAQGFERSLQENDVSNVQVVKTGCVGNCSKGPIVSTEPDGTLYTKTKIESTDIIVKEHIVGGSPSVKFIYRDAKTKQPTSLRDADFFKHQKRIALERNGVVDPNCINSFIQLNGFLALKKSLTEMSPNEVIQTVMQSGLKGRGGGGFSTGQKWQQAKDLQSDKKYVIANADEGDPGSFMDRAILEGDPFAIIEAMAIAGYCIGASESFLYIRPEYELALKRVRNAIKISNENGYLGNGIFGTNFNFKISIRYGAGTFIGGEETAIIKTIQGERGVPDIRTNFPTKYGLFGKPTVINNIETLANIGKIIVNGADWYSSFGTKDSPGTKIFSVGGDSVHTGLVEVPFGTTIKEIVYDISGGVAKKGREIKAVNIGGPSGSVIPAHLFDTPLEYNSLKELGGMVGSGDFIIMDEKKCMVNFAKFFIEFLADESCGKCSPCRIGLVRIREKLTSITNGTATMQDLEELEELAEMVKELSMCGLGKEAVNPLVSTLKFYKDEYVLHINDKKCVGGECEHLTTLEIRNNCIGCTSCARVCPVNAISGAPKQTHVLDAQTCINCNSCVNVCPVNAIHSDIYLAKMVG